MKVTSTEDTQGDRLIRAFQDLTDREWIVVTSHLPGEAPERLWTPRIRAYYELRREINAPARDPDE